MSNTSENTKLNCEIVRDLLPLYHDGVVSEFTKSSVEEHLSKCESCKKEYDELSIELPIQSSDNNTKSKFSSMMSKLRIKRICIFIISIVLSCVLVASAIFVLTEVPCVKIPDSEIQIHKAYGYETETGYEFFILYDITNYESMFFGLGEYANGTQYLEAKKPIISEKFDSYEEIWTFSYEYPSKNGKGLEELSFGGEIIWCKEDNHDDKIPDYVFEYNSNESLACDIDVNKGYIELYYPDNSFKKWTLEGKLIDQGHITENK